MIDTTLIAQYWPNFVRGALTTLYIAALGCAIGITLGAMLGLIQSGKNTLLKALVTLYVTLFRGTPMLIQITFAVFVLPQLGINFSDFWAATLAIGFNSAAYLSQTIRSGIGSVNKGQIEAAKALGLSSLQTTRYIILPQALRAILPALGNEFITLVKDSSLASTVGVMELSKEAWYIRSRTFDAITVYCAVAAVYLTITSLLSLGLYLFEKRINRHVNH